MLLAAGINLCTAALIESPCLLLLAVSTNQALCLLSAMHSLSQHWQALASLQLCN